MSETSGQETPVLWFSVRTAMVMLVFTLVFTALMAGTYLATKDTIARSGEQEKLKLIDEVLPPGSYDNALLHDELKLGPTPELGLNSGGHAWRARKAGQPVALIIETVARDGYAGRIALLVSILADGRVGGVRVTEHHETPGLGDYIDPKKDKNKASPWISQFEGKSPASLPLDRWKTRKDGGDFTYRAGATISARAVTGAVARALSFAVKNREALYR